MCGAVGYKYEGEPAVTALCHCIDCQKVRSKHLNDTSYLS